MAARRQALSAGFFASASRPGTGKEKIKFTIKSSPVKARVESIFKRSQEIEEGEETVGVPLTETGTITTRATDPDAPHSVPSQRMKNLISEVKANGEGAELVTEGTWRPSGAKEESTGKKANGVTTLVVAEENALCKPNGVTIAKDIGSDNGNHVEDRAKAENDAAEEPSVRTDNTVGRLACVATERTSNRPLDSSMAMSKEKPKRPREDVEEGEICSDDEEEEPDQNVKSLAWSPRQMGEQYGRKKARFGGHEGDLTRAVGNHIDNKHKVFGNDRQALTSAGRRPSMENGYIKHPDRDRVRVGRDDDRFSRTSRASNERTPPPDDRTARFLHHGKSPSYCGRSPRSNDSSSPRRSWSPRRQSPPRQARSPRRPSASRRRCSPTRALRERLPCRWRDDPYGRSRDYSPDRRDYHPRPLRWGENEFKRDYHAPDLSSDLRGREKHPVGRLAGGDGRAYGRGSPGREPAQKPPAFRDRGYHMPEFISPHRRRPDQQEAAELRALEERKETERLAREEEYEYAIKLSEETLHTKLLEALLRGPAPHASNQKVEIKRRIRKILHSGFLPFETPSVRRQKLG